MSVSIKSTVDIFKALGDETRLKIVKIIAERGNNLCVGAIVQHLNVSQPAVSQHLKVLKNAGLVEANREGFHVHYKLVSHALDPLGIDLRSLLGTFGADFLPENCCDNAEKTEKCREMQQLP